MIFHSSVRKQGRTMVVQIGMTFSRAICQHLMKISNIRTFKPETALTVIMPKIYMEMQNISNNKKIFKKSH